jgi:hypothetical protein
MAVTAGGASADQLLTGSIASASGQKLEGVQVSAKKEGTTITTSVYTDQNGDYFFPTLPDGKYQVWAQALGFHTAKGAVELSATRHQDFQLTAMTDPERCPMRRRKTPTSRRSSPTNAPAATPRAIRCSSSSMRPAGTRSST